MVLALTDTGSARTGRGVICTPAFCMACASASESVSVQPCWRGWSGPWPVFLARISAARPMRGWWALAALVVLEWAYYARTARGQALVERHKEYVEAARGLGVSGWRIMVRHILPN